MKPSEDTREILDNKKRPNFEKKLGGIVVKMRKTTDL